MGLFMNSNAALRLAAFTDSASPALHFHDHQHAKDNVFAVNLRENLIQTNFISQCRCADTPENLQEGILKAKSGKSVQEKCTKPSRVFMVKKALLAPVP